MMYYKNPIAKARMTRAKSVIRETAAGMSSQAKKKMPRLSRFMGNGNEGNTNRLHKEIERRGNQLSRLNYSR